MAAVGFLSGQDTVCASEVCVIASFFQLKGMASLLEACMRLGTCFPLRIIASAWGECAVKRGRQHSVEIQSSSRSNVFMPLGPNTEYYWYIADLAAERPSTE